MAGRSISDEWVDRYSCSTVMRLMCLAWLLPAVSMVFVGLASIGSRSADTPSLDLAFGRIQAAVMLLAIFGLVLGLIWALRAWAYLPAVNRIGTTRSPWFGPASHVVAAVVGLSSAAATLLLNGGSSFGQASAFESARPILLAVAAISGFYACSLAGRWVLQAPVAAAFPLAMLVYGASFEITVGWLHRANPTGALAPLLVVEGLVLAWISVSAARAVAAVAVFGQSSDPLMTAASIDEQAGPSTNPAIGILQTISQAPAQPQLLEPVVGH